MADAIPAWGGAKAAFGRKSFVADRQAKGTGDAEGGAIALIFSAIISAGNSTHNGLTPQGI